MRRALCCVLIGAAVVTVAPLASGVSAPSTVDKLRLRVIPAVGGPPLRLKPGAYRTRLGFAPVSTFRVGRGWYGAGDTRSWAIGKGVDRVALRFNTAIYVDRVRLDFSTAVSRFKGISTLDPGEGTSTMIGGYQGIVFKARVKGESAVLEEALGIGVDISAGVDATQIFLNVRAKTLLIRTEVVPGKGEATAIAAALRTLRFPRL